MFFGFGLAQGFCHDFGLAEEDARVGEVGADVFEVGVAHVFDAEDVDVGEVVGGVADVVEELCAQFLVLFLDLGQVDDLGALGLGHGGGLLCGVFGLDGVGLLVGAIGKKVYE